MISPRVKQTLENQNRVLTVIWGSFLTAALLYIAVGYLVATRDPAAPARGGSFALTVGLVVAAVVLVVAGRLLLQRRLARADRGAASMIASGRIMTPGSAPPPGGELEPAEREVLGLAAYYQTTLIIVWACYEAVAVLGLVGTILDLDVRPVVVGAVAAVALIGTTRPQLEDFLQDCRARGWINL